VVTLTRAELVRFFRLLDRELSTRAKLVVTGGAEAMLLGGVRPTGDADFGVLTSPSAWGDVERAIATAAARTGIAVQYSQDIDRWSSVAIPRARFRTRPWKRYRRLNVHLLDPGCWAVYKLARYLEADVQDLLAVLRRERVSSARLSRLCGESLRASPRSPVLFLFRRQVEHFFRTHGRTIWGGGYDPERSIAAFHRAAGPQPAARLRGRRR
jgi:hypothetical protein